MRFDIPDEMRDGEADNFRHVLILTERMLILTGIASALWHVPTDIAILRFLLTAVAVLVAFPIIVLLPLSAAVWRNVAWRATAARLIEWRGGRLANILLGLPFLGLLCLMTAGTFFAVGRLVHALF